MKTGDLEKDPVLNTSSCLAGVGGGAGRRQVRRRSGQGGQITGLVLTPTPPWLTAPGSPPRPWAPGPARSPPHPQPRALCRPGKGRGPVAKAPPVLGPGTCCFMGQPPQAVLQRLQPPPLCPPEMHLGLMVLQRAQRHWQRPLLVLASLPLERKEENIGFFTKGTFLLLLLARRAPDSGLCGFFGGSA